MGFLKKNGKLAVKNGKFVIAKAGCSCCGGDCDPACDITKNPAATCPNGKPSAYITCTQPDCDKHPDFNTCVDHGTPLQPDRLREILKQQGWAVTINDGDTHPEGCCDCEGTSHYSVFACCDGKLRTDAFASRWAPVNPDSPCENCQAGGDGIVREGDLWRVYLCEQGDPCQTPCADCVYQTATVKIDLPAFVERDGAGDPLFTFPAFQGTITIQLQKNEQNGIFVYLGFDNFPAAQWGAFAEVTVQNCNTNNDGKWQVVLSIDQGGENNIGTRKVGATYSVCCGVEWKGQIGPNGETGEVSFGMGPKPQRNPLP